MIKNIVFLVEAPFGKRDFDRFGIEFLCQNDFYVEVWDLTFIINSQLRDQDYSKVFYYFDGLTVFYEKQKVINKLLGLTKKEFVFNFLGYNYSSFAIYEALSMTKVDYAVLMANVLPSFNRKVISGNIFDKCKRLYPFKMDKFLNPIINKVPSQWLGIKPASLALVGGSRSLLRNRIIDRETELLFCHAFDYDLYLKEFQTPCKERPIAVFLDQCVPFPGDKIFTGIKACISADKYYLLLNNFFQLVEKKMRIKIVVAVHPRSPKESILKYFKGYECVSGQTISLVKNSRFILAHDSTSLNFANLFYKPVIFLTSYDLDTTLRGRCTREMAMWFGKKPIFIDSNVDIDWEGESRVDKAVYDCYRRCYIKREDSDALPFWQIVANRLKKGFK